MPSRLQSTNETERQVIAAYSKLETAAMAHNSAVFATMVGDEFVVPGPRVVDATRWLARTLHAELYK